MRTTTLWRTSCPAWTKCTPERRKHRSATCGSGNSRFGCWHVRGIVWYPERVKTAGEGSAMTFGEKLQKLRTRAGLSQDAACRAAGCEPPGGEQVGAERGHAGGGEARPHQPPVRRVHGLLIAGRTRGAGDGQVPRLLRRACGSGSSNGTGTGAICWPGFWRPGVVWNLVDLAVLAANTYQQAQDLENFAWVKYVQMVYIPTMILPCAADVAVCDVLVFRGRQLAGRLRWYHLGWLLVLMGLLNMRLCPSRASAVFGRRGRSGVFPLRCWCIWRSTGRRHMWEFCGGDFLGRPALSCW